MISIFALSVTIQDAFDAFICRISFFYLMAFILDLDIAETQFLDWLLAATESWRSQMIFAN